ncbi:hypothetical protein GGU10DRAFT_191846 [Lentinula aff. detonsa]|uniref:Uncharacterized protein n=1 Tax=Lentinula aff. detonsa TaxID=2804958 RepID=A0AA38KZI6_9AGAR|nr:hypothetical protein GGU10DRAFT_191846 [Lentinula aff. detonsa]
MPFIHNEQTYATSKNIRPLGEHAYTQDSGDLMAPTLPLPQGQISNEDIAIITLTAILILICGTAAISFPIRVVRRTWTRSKTVDNFALQSGSGVRVGHFMICAAGCWCSGWIRNPHTILWIMGIVSPDSDPESPLYIVFDGDCRRDTSRLLASILKEGDHQKVIMLGTHIVYGIASGLGHIFENFPDLSNDTDHFNIFSDPQGIGRREISRDVKPTWGYFIKADSNVGLCSSLIREIFDDVNDIVNDWLPEVDANGWETRVDPTTMSYRQILAWVIWPCRNTTKLSAISIVDQGLSRHSNNKAEYAPPQLLVSMGRKYRATPLSVT